MEPQKLNCTSHVSFGRYWVWDYMVQRTSWLRQVNWINWFTGLMIIAAFQWSFQTQFLTLCFRYQVQSELSSSFQTQSATGFTRFFHCDKAGAIVGTTQILYNAFLKNVEAVVITPKPSNRPGQNQYPLKKEAIEGIKLFFESLKVGVIVPC